MSALPVSAVLVMWLHAVREGHAAPDDLADAVRGNDAWHLVTGLPEREALELLDLPAALSGTVSLALPVPGDPVGLGGPPSFNLAAMEAGEAVVAGGVGLVPATDARTVVWRAHRAEPVPWVDERETAWEGSGSCLPRSPAVWSTSRSPAEQPGQRVESMAHEPTPWKPPGWRSSSEVRHRPVAATSPFPEVP